MYPDKLIRIARVGGLVVFGISILMLWLTVGSWIHSLAYIFVPLTLAFIFHSALIFVMPLKCPRPGCKGSMHRLWIRVDRFTKNLECKCSICGEMRDLDFEKTWGEVGNSPF